LPFIPLKHNVSILIAARRSLRRRLSELRGRTQQQPGDLKMDDASAKAGREEILPGDLLQGIAAASYADLSDRSVDPTRASDFIKLFPSS